MKIGKSKILKVMVLSFVLAFTVPGVCCLNNTGTVQAAAKVTLNKKKASIKLNKTTTLKVRNATKKVKWTTSNKKVVKIQKTSGTKKQNAVIRGMKKGKATVTAKIGSRKLKAKITVKHTHSYTYPATCTSPARCSCGVTYGGALGHNWSTATCVARSKCSRCGAVGALGGHSYNSSHICNNCSFVELDKVLGFCFEKAGDFIYMYASDFIGGDFNFVTDSFTLRPTSDSSQTCDLAYEGGANTAIPEYPTVGQRLLRIPISLSGWKSPRLEFDITVDIRTTTSGKIVIDTQRYHVVIQGESSCFRNGRVDAAAVVDAVNGKVFSYTRIR